MSGAELGLAIFATVDICLKYGVKLVKLYKSFQHAELEVVESVARLENAWLRTHDQLEFLKRERVWASLDKRYRENQFQLLRVFNGKLEIAVSKIEALTRSQSQSENPAPPSASPSTVDTSGAEQTVRVVRVRKFKYSLFKDGLNNAVKEVEDWQRVFDPSWLSSIKSASSQIDAELATVSDKKACTSITTASHLRDASRTEPQKHISIFLPNAEPQFADIIPVQHSSVHLARRQGSKKWMILESIARRSHLNASNFTRDVRNLATRLHCADPLLFGLLVCRGVVKEIDPKSKDLLGVTFVYRIPEGCSEPTSLRSHVLNRFQSHSLTERFRIAKELARAISYVHIFDFVHKNIRPETILLLKREDTALASAESLASLGSLYLVGMEDFRTAEGRTMRISSSSWERDLYRHPDRQGDRPEAEYIMQHDIYSLGVCLLEVGLWQPFVEYGTDGVSVQPNRQLFGMACHPNSVQPQELKKNLLHLAQTQLPLRMGTRYSDIVQTCLTCLDEGNPDFVDESEFHDEDGILVGVRYVQKILAQISEISI